MSLLPILALLLVLFIGVNHLFEWLDPAHIEHDVPIQKKTTLLKFTVFHYSHIIYFNVLLVICILLKQSIKTLQQQEV